MNSMSTSCVASERPVAMVTGSGRRLGRALAEALAARGYRLVLHANETLRDAERMAQALSTGGSPAIALGADLRDERQVREMVAAAQSHFGRIDALVNNAAIWNAKPLEQVTAADVREHFEINTLGTFVCSQAVGLAMVSQATGGAIVNVGDWAIGRPYRDYAAYFVSKGSIPTLTRALAVELGTRNPKVRVNAVLPGPVLLPEGMSAVERRQVVEATLAKREGTPRDLADAVIFLLENTFVTGVSLPVDGGRGIFGDTREV